MDALGSKRIAGWLALALLALAPAQALADKTVTATGYAFCFDGTSGKTLPLEGARVELMDSDCDGSEICDDVMGTSHVNADGSFSVTGVGGDPGWIGSDPDVYVRFAYNDDKGVRLTDEADVTRSWNMPEHDHDNFGGGTIDFGAWTTGLGVGPGEGTRCGVWLAAHKAYQAYIAEMGGAEPPAGHLDVEYWSAIFAGTPWTNVDTIHWPIHFGSGALIHEFGHSVRHAADGSAAHFTYDVGRFAYARTHAPCSDNGNRNGGESDESLRGYAFNEGWAEYWEGQGCPDNATPAEFREGAIASHLRRLQTANGKTRKDMVAVLLANPGQIHSLPEYEGRFAAMYGVAVSRSPLTTAKAPIQRAAITLAQRSRAVEAGAAEIGARLDQIRVRLAETRKPAVKRPERPCRVCEATFKQVVGPELLAGRGRRAADPARGSAPHIERRLDLADPDRPSRRPLRGLRRRLRRGAAPVAGAGAGSGAVAGPGEPAGLARPLLPLRVRRRGRRAGQGPVAPGGTHRRRRGPWPRRTQGARSDRLAGEPGRRRRRAATGRPQSLMVVRERLERAMRFELTTPTLARLCSTPELRPQTVDFTRFRLLSQALRRFATERALLDELRRRGQGRAESGAFLLGHTSGKRAATSFCEEIPRLRPAPRLPMPTADPRASTGTA